MYVYTFCVYMYIIYILCVYVVIGSVGATMFQQTHLSAYRVAVGTIPGCRAKVKTVIKFFAHMCL